MLKTIIEETKILYVPGTEATTVEYIANFWLEKAAAAIEKKGRFAVALSGGSTPKKIFHHLSQHGRKKIDWQKVWFFWSDERAVPLDHPDSNYHMAMTVAGLKNLGVPEKQIFPMQADHAIEKHAQSYEEMLQQVLGDEWLDLTMLGVGEDGHTASLFPGTKALTEEKRRVIENFVPAKKTWRMTLTFRGIQNSQAILFCALGAGKQTILQKIFLQNLNFPANKIGLCNNKAIWIADKSAAMLLL